MGNSNNTLKQSNVKNDSETLDWMNQNSLMEKF
jgi:hypothetical protein